MALTKRDKRIRIKKRVRQNISGTEQKPRLTVFRSNKQIYAQIIDDANGITLAAAGSLEKDVTETKKSEQAKQVGKLIAEKALEKGIKQVVFDRNGYQYHGRIKTLADAARENGLKF
jgi:large subunit ribosomal protein L18